MKIVDNKISLTVKQVEGLWDKVETIDKARYTTWFWESEILTLHIDRRIHKHLSFLNKRNDFKIDLMKDGKHAEIWVRCRVLPEEYDEDYLNKLGALLEKEQFEVTAYLMRPFARVEKKDC